MSNSTKYLYVFVLLLALVCASCASGVSGQERGQEDLERPITKEMPLPEAELKRQMENPPEIDVAALRANMREQVPNPVSVAGKHTAGMVVTEDMFGPAVVKLSPDVYIDGVIISEQCPDATACTKMPALVLRTIDDRAIGFVDGDGNLIDRDNSGRFKNVEIIKANAPGSSVSLEEKK